MAIREVGYFNLDTADFRAYGYGGFAGIQSIQDRVPVGRVTITFDGQLFQGACTAADVQPDLANLVFENDVYRLTVTLVPSLKEVQAFLEPKLPEVAIRVMAANKADFDKPWEYVYILIH